MLNFPPADFSRCNTLALPCRAAQALRVDSLVQLQAALPQVAAAPRRLVLGGGSNVVLPANFAGLLLHMAIPGRALLGEDEAAWYVAAGAGENWHEFVLWTLEQGWPGLENLVLIPGTVGAAPIQNIGAYGREAGELVHEVEVLEVESGELRRFDRAACRFGYRDSVFKQAGWHRDGSRVITRVIFRLPKAWRAQTAYADVAGELAAQGLAEGQGPTASQIAAAVTIIRRRKLPDPAVLPNAGSFFQNPVVSAATAAALAAAHPRLPQYAQADGSVKLAAGWLIEQAGWKGKRLGAVGMYERQALVLVNHGGADRVAVAALTAAVQADVQALFGVMLQPEPIFVEGE